MENTQTHTHYTHARKRGCQQRGGARHEGKCEGEAAGSEEGLTEHAPQGEDTTKTKNQLKQPLNTKHSLYTNSN